MSIAVVVLMVTILQYCARKNFSRYVRKVEMEEVADLAEALQTEYLREQSWEPLRNNSRRWRELTRPHRFGREFMPPPLSPPRPFGRSNLESFSSETRPPHENPRRDDRDKRPPPRPPGPFGIEQRVTLFDANKNRIAGPAHSGEGHILKEIVANKRIVGWLGLREVEGLRNPVDIEFLRRQSQAFYIVGGLALLLSALVSLLLSRHLLSPIKELAKGTRALASRDFSTRIAVASSDELGQLASDFNAMAHTLGKYELTRQQWLSDISHELRTPLAILRGEIEALQDGVRKASPHAVDSLHSEVLRISRIVDDLHELSLAESETLHFKREPVAIVRVVRETLRAFHQRFVEQQIALIDQLGDDETITLVGDKDRLAQLFANLLENTLRHTDPPGSLRIWQSRNETGLSFFFEDTAPGVPESSLPRLFDRLYRVEPSRSRTKGGSGLGLAICKNIVEAHGGRITAANAPSGGLCMEIAFPLQPA